MPQFAIIEASFNAGPPGTALLTELERFTDSSTSINLTEVREARADMFLGAEALDANDIIKARAFYKRVEEYYRDHEYTPDTYLTVDLYPISSNGTEVMFVEQAQEIGEPGGLLLNYLDDRIVGETLTLKDVRSAYDDSGAEDEDETATEFVNRFAGYCSKRDVAEDEPVALTIW